MIDVDDGRFFLIFQRENIKENENIDISFKGRGKSDIQQVM